jgi:hypothetical protein
MQYRSLFLALLCASSIFTASGVSPRKGRHSPDRSPSPKLSVEVSGDDYVPAHKRVKAPSSKKTCQFMDFSGFERVAPTKQRVTGDEPIETIASALNQAAGFELYNVESLRQEAAHQLRLTPEHEFEQFLAHYRKQWDTRNFQGKWNPYQVNSKHAMANLIRTKGNDFPSDNIVLQLLHRALNMNFLVIRSQQHFETIGQGNLPTIIMDERFSLVVGHKNQETQSVFEPVQVQLISVMKSAFLGCFTEQQPIVVDVSEESTMASNSTSGSNSPMMDLLNSTSSTSSISSSSSGRVASPVDHIFNRKCSLLDFKGFVAYDAGGGGDCQFHSIAAALNFEQNDARMFNFRHLRNMAAEELKNLSPDDFAAMKESYVNEVMFNEFVGDWDPLSIETPGDLARQLKTPGFHYQGDHHTLRLLRSALQVDFLVWSHGAWTNLIGEEPFDRVIVLWYDGIHYRLIVAKNNEGLQTIFSYFEAEMMRQFTEQFVECYNPSTLLPSLFSRA